MNSGTRIDGDSGIFLRTTIGTQIELPPNLTAIVSNFPGLSVFQQRPCFPDPNIPETGEQKRKSTIGDEDCCYTHCGSPGRGLCEHCPGRPDTPDTPHPVDCPTDNTTKASGCRTSAAAPTRTLNKVFLLWTAWIILTQTTNTNMLLRFLVMCATSVQRTTWIKTKRRPCS